MIKSFTVGDNVLLSLITVFKDTNDIYLNLSFLETIYGFLWIFEKKYEWSWNMEMGLS